MSLTIETCPITREHPGLCCLMQLNDPDVRCRFPAEFVVIVDEDGQLSEHLRCAHHAEKETERASTLGMKPYQPREGYEVEVGHLSGLDDELRQLAVSDDRCIGFPEVVVTADAGLIARCSIAGSDGWSGPLMWVTPQVMAELVDRHAIECTNRRARA